MDVTAAMPTYTSSLLHRATDIMPTAHCVRLVMLAPPFTVVWSRFKDCAAFTGKQGARQTPMEARESLSRRDVQLYF